jgi:hypothetical protein
MQATGWRVIAKIAISSDKAFSITASGHIGIGPPTILAGDEVWVLSGDRVPFVMRPTEEGITGELDHVGPNDYVFVGDAHICVRIHGSRGRDLLPRKPRDHSVILVG